MSKRYGPALGDGPVFATGLIGKGPLPFTYPPDPSSVFAGSPWGGNKVLWVASPAYTGPVLIRGASLDATGGLGFSIGDDPTAYTDLQFPPSDPGYNGWREWATATRLRASGCYAYQIDGLDFTEVIVFRATATTV